MKQVKYTDLPTAQRFESDTTVMFSFRHKDRILKRIDTLLEEYVKRKSADERGVILADLFLTCNHWIKEFHEKVSVPANAAGLDTHQKTLKERYPAVLALFEAVVEILCGAFNCGLKGLARIVEEIYGRDLHGHGIEVDLRDQQAMYLTKLARQPYRIRFAGGLAYQYEWWRTSYPSRLVLANSAHAYATIARRGVTKKASTLPDFGMFVMTLERDIFMAKPDIGANGKNNGLFHSSFTGGDIVIMAGTMLIRGGVILAIRPDSGHYKPTEMNMALLLQSLAMYSVNVDRIELYAWDATLLGTGNSFLKSRMSWKQFVEHRKDEQEHRIETDNHREFYGTGQKKFPHLKNAPPPAIPSLPKPPLPNTNLPNTGNLYLNKTSTNQLDSDTKLNYMTEG